MSKKRSTVSEGSKFSSTFMAGKFLYSSKSSNSLFSLDLLSIRSLRRPELTEVRKGKGEAGTGQRDPSRQHKFAKARCFLIEYILLKSRIKENNVCTRKKWLAGLFLLSIPLFSFPFVSRLTSFTVGMEVLEFSFPFGELFVELQSEVTRFLDSPSRFALALTSTTYCAIVRDPYYPGAKFAPDCIKLGHSQLLSWALERGLSQDFMHPAKMLQYGRVFDFPREIFDNAIKFHNQLHSPCFLAPNHR